MNPAVEAAFVVETSYEDEGTLRVFDDAGVIGYLRENIEREHYYGESDTVHGIYRYVSPGHLSELILISTGEATTTADDYIDRNYRLHNKADADAFGPCDDNKELEFTLRIDGRS